MKKYWLTFVCTQVVGVLLAIYSMSLEVGIGGWREFVWIPAGFLLLPGVLLPLAAGGLDVSAWLGRWYSVPLFTLAVAVNCASWAVAYVARKRKSRVPHALPPGS